MIKKLCVLSAYYPQSNDPIYSFVGTLIETIADMGVECHVISPVSYIEKKHKAETRIEKTKNGAEIHVYCPRYMIYPSRNILGFQTYRLTVNSLWRAIGRVFKDNIGHCDAIYSHFIDAGVNAAWLKKKTGIPAFMAVGESNVTMHKLTYTVFNDVLHDGLNGVISVSSQLREDLLEHDVISNKTPIVVAPNGIDIDLFKPADRGEARAKLGAKDEDYVISFVGAFIPRKGFDKLQQVIKKHPNWKCVFIGSGEIPVEIREDQVLFSGRIPHNEIPEMISGTDVFVLPTHAEGCCNAIIEAMGCGLPIISSNRAFNDDILDEMCSIKIDPEDADAIEDAMIMLQKDVELRKKLAEGALNRGRNLSIQNRAQKILDFMERNIHD